MKIKLNNKQKEIVMDFVDNGTNGYELIKYFYTFSRNEILTMDIEINNENVRYPFNNGWWNLVVDGEITTQLNFKVYPKVLKKIQALG